MSKTYYPTIGLEIHAELATDTKMFCACKNDPDEKNPNVNVCPVCMAHPGTLPVPNKDALGEVVRVGLSLGSTIADFTEFDRKNYFYPDIPKGYQISQYKYPIVSGGELADFPITRIHLEEDTGTSKHDKGEYSLVDFNRAGVPLMELVTGPRTFENAKDAAAAASRFAKEYQLILWYLGASEANMEKGEFRVEANISLSPDKDKLSERRVEVKNLNSFRSVERAILFELERMHDLYEEGRENEIVQETRGWDEGKLATFSQRSKENAEDYRYFPEPDIPKFMLKELFGTHYENVAPLPELPNEKRSRYISDFGLKDADIETYVNNPALSSWFENVVHVLGTDKEVIQTASNFTTSDMLGLLVKNPSLAYPQPEHFAKLIALFADGRLSSRAAKDLLPLIIAEGRDPEELAEEKGLFQSNNEDDLLPVIREVIATNEKIVADYKNGKEAAIQGLVGQVMKATRGSANPALALKLLKENI